MRKVRRRGDFFNGHRLLVGDLLVDLCSNKSFIDLTAYRSFNNQSADDAIVHYAIILAPAAVNADTNGLQDLKADLIKCFETCVQSLGCFST
jgi:hypothetical protein